MAHRGPRRLGKYNNICWYDQGFTKTWYEARTKRWIGGTQSYTAASYPTATFCNTYANTKSITIDDQRAVSWSNGFSVSAGFGINLSTTTGFASNAKQVWTLLNNTGPLCGTNDYPEATARTIVGG